MKCAHCNRPIEPLDRFIRVEGIDDERVYHDEPPQKRNEQSSKKNCWVAALKLVKVYT